MVETINCSLSSIRHTLLGLNVENDLMKYKKKEIFFERKKTGEKKEEDNHAERIKHAHYEGNYNREGIYLIDNRWEIVVWK